MVKHVPIRLIQYCITNKLIKQLRLFLYLKYKTSDGIIRSSKEEVSNIITHLGVCEKTYYRQIKSLVDLKFLNKDKCGFLYLRSWKRLEALLGLESKSRVDFHLSYINKTNHKGYFMGAVICYQCKLKNHHERKKRYKMTKSERKKRRSLPICKLWHPLSISYLSKILKIPKSTVQLYINEAVKRGFVIRRKNIVAEDIGSNVDINLLRKNWTKGSFPIYKFGKLFIIKPDSFRPQLHFKRFR